MAAERPSKKCGHDGTSSSPLTSQDVIDKIKRSKRVVTKTCPICGQAIPVRLLGTHAALESQRVEAIIGQIGSLEVIFDDMSDMHGPSSHVRRSAAKARKSITSSSGGSSSKDSVHLAERIIQTIKRRRRQRLAKFREMFRAEEGIDLCTRAKWTGVEVTCPICRSTVRGDHDVVDAHVDACLAGENYRLEEERQRVILDLGLREQNGGWHVDDHPEGAFGHVGSVQGTGIHIRNALDEDVDDEVNVDGDEGFGEPQFTEGDILPVGGQRSSAGDDAEVEREGGALRDLIVEGKNIRHVAYMDDSHLKGGATELDLAIIAARGRGDTVSLVAALEAKVKHLETARTSSLCRICLDPYTEPAISTGCWHVCCQECWLRCLGSTKLCPICKRITGAGDLRRIYL